MSTNPSLITNGGEKPAQRSDAPEPEAAPPVIEFKRLSEQCRRTAFHCGDDEIDKFFRRDAQKSHDDMRFRVRTAHEAGNEHPLGFYALTMKIERDSVLDVSERHLSFSEGGYFSTVRLAWLAVQISRQIQGIGKIIMGTVLQDFYEISVRTGIFAMTLTARNEEAADFYRRLGFVRYGKGIALDMLLPSRSVIEMIEAQTA